MKVPLSWLKEFLDFTLTPQELCDTLTRAGLEVDGMDPLPLNFSGVVVGKVVAVEKHPQAERLCVAMVSDGIEQFQVVCGAPNCRTGLTTAFAKIGATLKDADGKSFKIKKSKLRDVESFGMLCACDELGLGSDHEGILELSDDLVAGTPLEELYGDLILDISLTPNLGHCMSILGIARELSALLNIPVKMPQFSITESKEPTDISIQLIDKRQALYFASRLVKNIELRPSPPWLQKRLEACGIRSINNVVDVGNFVMLELGQPLHLFNYDAIADKKLIITSETPYSTLETLEGTERNIPPEAILVCDTQKPLSFAGVMGGKSSSVETGTRNILIEAAYFTPQAIRKSTKLLKVSSESSQRFEKGIDPRGIKAALNRAAYLLQTVAGGEICQGIVEAQAHAFEPKKICCRIARVNQILGTHLSLRDIVNILVRSKSEILKEEMHSLLVAVPTYRNDLLTEIDLIEEIARIYGYHNIPKKPPYHASSTLTAAPIYLLEKDIRSRLIAEGLQELMTCDLISPSLAEIGLSNTLSKDSLICVLHPSSIDQSVLRTSLLPGLLQVIKYNQDHSNNTICGFEVGKVHLKEGTQFKECSTMGIILTGKSAPHHFDPKPKDVDFLDLKGKIENLLLGLQITGVEFLPSHLHSLHPGKQAQIKVGDVILGVLGEVHPKNLKKLGMDQSIYFAELNIHDLLLLKSKETLVTELNPYPGSERDWTITVPDTLSIGDILKQLKSVPSRFLENVYLLDLYKSDQIGKDRKNVTLRFFYRDLNKTIAFETVEKEHERITQSLSFKNEVHHAN